MLVRDKNVHIIVSAVHLAMQMREAGVSRTGYSRILRETVFFSWETFGEPKYSQNRPRSVSSVGLLRRCLDYDHAIPMSIVIDDLVNAGPKPEAVLNILQTKVLGVLLTKEEHAALRNSGLSASMPPGWDGVDKYARYRILGIEIVGGAVEELRETA